MGVLTMGDVILTSEQLEALLDRVAKKGARAALEELGLHDEQAGKDIDQLRDLLASWRETKKAVWGTFVKALTTSFLLFIAAAVGFYVKNNSGPQ